MNLYSNAVVLKVWSAQMLRGKTNLIKLNVQTAHNVTESETLSNPVLNIC